MSVDYAHAYGEVQETRSAFSGVSSSYTQGKSPKEILVVVVAVAVVVVVVKTFRL